APFFNGVERPYYGVQRVKKWMRSTSEKEQSLQENPAKRIKTNLLKTAASTYVLAQ
ncbi:hypothetical protein SUGI_0693720, partial [Cryptomeria japonica]